MTDREFKKFLEEVQVSAVSEAPMPRMSDKKPAPKSKTAQNSAGLAGNKRPASKVVSQKASAPQASKRTKRWEARHKEIR